MKKRLTFLILASALICSCSGEATKQYDPYANREIEATNIYSGDGKDFHLHGWYGSSFGVFDVTENDNIIQASYTKEKDYEYANLYTTVQGRFADFEYINIKAKGTLGKAIAFRMYYGESESETNNVLGNDVSFSLSEQFETYSLKVKDIYKTRMDLLTRVCIFPEIGVAASGKFEFSDVWFSKAIPEGSSLKNEGVDNGDIKVNVNGWTTDAWTQYTLYALGNKTGVKYSRAAEYALIQKDITIGEEDAMSFKFQNVKFGTKYSITCIRFSLRGDVLRHVSEDVPYPYDLYYESDLYHYDNTNPEEVQPDENGVVSLKFSLKAAIDAIGEHHANGYHLALMIESHPEDDRKYINYRNGEMIIEEVSLFVDEKKEFDVDGWSSEDWTHYSISKVENDVVVAYEQTAEYGFIQKTLELTANDNAINFSFKNIDSSVKDIHFILRGDFKEHVKPEGKEEYDLFHESEMYHYSLNKDFEYQADANGVITVKIPLNDAIKAIGENNKEGYRLVLNIDSHPDDKVDYKSAKGTMNIIETKIYHDEWKELEIDDWSTEEWSTYYIRNIDNDITVQYKKVTKSQTVQKEITLKENENAATFSFKNIDNSVSNIRFMLRGDIKEHVKPENGDEYDLYYESEIYRYSIDKDFEVEPDENGVISIKMPLMDALDYIGENNKNGLKFVMFIESHEEEAIEFEKESGKMVIEGLKFSHDEWKELQIDGWTTEEWTRYNIIGSDDGVKIRYKQIGNSYAYVSKDIDINDTDNALTFSFKNIALHNNEPSISSLRILIRADVKEHVTPESGDEYDLYYENELYKYNSQNEDEVQPDENGIITLNVSLFETLQIIGDHHENGYRLILLIESHEEDFPLIGENKDGEMIITETKIWHNDNYFREYYSIDNPDDERYQLSEIDNGELNITYKDVGGSDYYPRIARKIETTHDNVITLTVKNTGESSMKLRVRAGIFEDERSDEMNNKFFPLWNYNGKYGGYYSDGEDADIDVGESKIFTISVNNPDATSEDAIDSIIFLVDNFYGDDVVRSGSLDILSIEIN